MKEVEFLWISLFMLMSNILPGQDSCFLSQRVVCADTDKLEHLYLATEQNDVIKYDAYCREMYRYTNNYLGYPSRIDASNPINVICYYPSIQTVVTLDVTMNEISRTDLIGLGFLDVRAVCSSNDGNLWILDAMDFKLKKINRLGRILAESENLILLISKWPTITYMQELNNLVFLLEPNEAIYRFDNFGNFKSKQSIPGVRGLHLVSNTLFYWTDLVLERQHLRNKSIEYVMKLDPDAPPLLIHHRLGRRWVVMRDRQWIVNTTQ